MALKFLNKKGWHTGSLRNIENVWKAEQKHDAEQKKLEELRKQIHEERERSEFRQLQEQAGLVPRQERLEFLYDSGLAVGKTSEGGSFKALEAATPKPSADAAAESSSKQAAAAAPGALFEEKPQSANDTWRKLHSDPLLMIRQREQEALARVKNNPVQMAMIRKSIESKSKKEKDKDGDKKERKTKSRDKKEHKSHDKRERQEKRHHTSSKHQKHSSSRQQSDSDNDTDEDIKGRKSGNRTEDYDKHYHKRHTDSGSELSERDGRSNKSQYKRLKDEEQSPKGRSDSRTRKDDDQDAIRKNHDKSKHDRYSSKDRIDIDDSGKERENKRFHDSRSHNSSATGLQHEARRKQRYVAPKLSEEERAARLREMQMDAEVHEEQRWKRLKKAEDDDAREASLAKVSGGRNFLDAAHRSVYGAEKGGSSTIEESVRRRTHYRQGRSEASEGNAFRR